MKQKPLELRDWSGADAGLRQLGLEQLAVERIEARLNERIARLKEEAAAASAPHQVAIEELEDALTLFWDANKKDIAPRKSWRGTFGEIGARAARPAVRLLRGWTMERVVDALATGFRKFLYEPPPQLDKNAILRASAEEREAIKKLCGVAIEEGGERVYLKPDRARIAEEPDAAA